MSISVFFGGRNIAKFRPEKYGFNLYKGFSMNKWAQKELNFGGPTMLSGVG
jgi:hypothetical protein